MTKILIVQFRKNPDLVLNEQRCFERELGKENTERIFIDSLDESLPWEQPESLFKDVQGVILGGSGDYDFDGGRPDDDVAKQTAHLLAQRLKKSLDFLREHQIPVLGICFGHQLMGIYHGVQVVNDVRQKKIGSHEVAMTETGKSDPLFDSLPEKFFAQYGHKDSLSQIPQTAQLLAAGESCGCAALRYEKDHYSVQFHPEMTEEDVSLRLQKSPGYLPEGVAITDVIKPSPYASKLLNNFLKLIHSRG